MKDKSAGNDDAVFSNTEAVDEITDIKFRNLPNDSAQLSFSAYDIQR